MPRHALLILLLAVAAMPVAGADWLPVSLAPDVVVYDYDKDGTPEVVLTGRTGGVYENTAYLRLPYPQTLPRAALVDFDWDGEPDLVLYSDEWVAIYNGTRLVAAYNVTASTRPLTSLDGRALAFNNTVISRDGVKTFPARAVPFTMGTTWAAYVLNGTLYISDGEGRTHAVYPDSLEPLGAYAVNNVVYILARAGNSTLYITYNVRTGGTMITAFVTPIERVVYFDARHRAFYGVSAGGVWRVTRGGAVLEHEGEPVWVDGSGLIYIVAGSTLHVYSPSRREVLASMELPRPNPAKVAADYPVVAAVYEDAVYLKVDIPKPRVSLSVQRRAVVNERIYYRVATDAEEVSVLVDGKHYPPEGYVSFETAGPHNITVVASNALYTVTKTYTVHVDPRPVRVSYSISSRKAFAPTNITVKTFDARTGERVVLNCTITIGDWSVETVSWHPTTVILEADGREAPLSIACRGNKVYEGASLETKIRVAPVDPGLDYQYLGEGELRLVFTRPDGAPANGTVTVRVDTGDVFTGDNPLTIRLDPGRHVLRIRFESGDPVVRSVTLHVTVEYYYDAGEVPEPLRDRVVVADRVVNETRTVIENRTVTVTEQVRVVEKVVDAPKTALAVVVAAAAAAGATRLLTARSNGEALRQAPGGEEEEEVGLE